MKRRSVLVAGGAGVVLTAAGASWLGARQGEDKASAPEGAPETASPSEKGASTRRSARAKKDRPNILMISIDDMKPWVGPYGFTDAKTPAMDALAQRGLIFTRAYCAAPACSPSRAAVFTGQAPHETGCYFNRQSWQDHKPKLTTLPRLFRQSGYHTAGFGKLFHSRSHDDVGAWDERRHHHLLKAPKGAPLNIPESIYRKSGSRFDWAPVDIPVEEMDDHKQVNSSIDAMKRLTDKPWFIACGLFRPHLPWYVPRRFFDMHPLSEVKIPETIADDLADVPKMGQALAKQSEHKVIVSHHLWRPAVQAYMASISYADFELGRLLASVADDTIVVIWSDHGWHLGPKNHWHKYALWEEASQSILAFQGPDIASGVRCERTVSLNDIYPTLTELCGLKAPHKLAGNSLVPLLENPTAAWEHPALTTYGADNHAIRNERFRYIRYSDGGEELYDHDEDPHEWHNLVGAPGSSATISELAAYVPESSAHQRECSDSVLPWIKLKPKDKKKNKGKRRALIPS